MILPVIMAGGVGSRLWPLSRQLFPKQFLSLMGNNSMLQETVLRLSSIDHAPPLVICNEDHRFFVAEQLRNIDVKPDSIILEPIGRNTAPAVALAAIKALKDGQDPLLLVLAADHLINDHIAFCDAIDQAVSFAEEGKLVTFGVVADIPETGYGYIKKGQKISDTSGFNVDRFVEKPDFNTAKSYVDSGCYFWNSGMFLFKASSYLDELKSLRPDIFSSCYKAMEDAREDLDFIRVNKSEFESCAGDSIDYAIMENTSKSVVVPIDCGWSDVGSWSSLWDICDKDDHGNVFRGDVIDIETRNTFVNASHKLVATIGVSDLAIVETKDAILVSKLSDVQKVKNVVEILKGTNRNEWQYHQEVYRPWGVYEHIADGDRYHVKRVVVKPGEKTAMQLHYHRAEHWVVVSGTAEVYRGKEKHIITENESIYIPVGTEHCFKNPGKFPLEIIEVRTGSYLAEDDIVRINLQGEGY